jgi:hypothetical protein
MSASRNSVRTLLVLLTVGWGTSTTVPSKVAVMMMASGHTTVSSTAAHWLCSEVNKRLNTRSMGGGDAVGWSMATSSSSDDSAPHIVLAVVAADDELATTSPCGGLPNTPGSFLLHTTSATEPGSPMLRVLATDVAGMRSGSSRLLREAHLPPSQQSEHPTATPGGVTFPDDLCIRYDASTALWHTRGTMVHQFQTRSQFEQYAQDLAVFGTNQLEMVQSESELSGPTPSP